MKEAGLLRPIADSSSFGLVDLILVSTSGVAWVLKPELGAGVILIAAMPWGIRLLAGRFPFRRTVLDGLVALFLVTAWVGYWAAYDKQAAWNKVWLIMLAVLLYYALAGQPRENLEWICCFLFCIGLGVSIYFLLTHDFLILPRKVEVINRIGLWLMEIRPRLRWTPIHPNYVAGVTAILTPFVLYPASKLLRKTDWLSVVLCGLIVVGASLSLAAILMATSRGIIMAVVGAAGILVVRHIIQLNGSRLRLQNRTIFATFVIFYLFAIIITLYSGPAMSGSVLLDRYFETASRRGLFARSISLVFDFPFTGGGLNSYPGLYSYYILGIPFFNVVNSHNLFLDITIEQGLLGGISFFTIFLFGIWSIAKVIAISDSSQPLLLIWLTLVCLVVAFIHGMVDDYLYNGIGTLLVLVPAGLAMMVQPESSPGSSRSLLGLQLFVALGVLGFILINMKVIRSAWYANLGAIQMAKVQLAGFPTNHWTEPSILPMLDPADATFHAALQANPANPTANYRMGLITMLRQDFPSAAAYLEKANQGAYPHRGLTKALGYCYVWLGNMERASTFLNQISEARDELDVYVWWWGMQGRDDLAQNASIMYSRLFSEFPGAE